MTNLKTRKKGQSTVEFALVLPLVLVLFLGVIDMGITFHIWSSLNQQCSLAAKSASKRIFQLVARNVFSSTTHESLANVQTTFWFYRSPLMPTTSYKNVTFDGVGTTQTQVTISADFELSLYTPLIGSLVGGTSKDGKLTLHASASERKE